MMRPTAILLSHFAGYLLQFRGAVIAELARRGYRVVVFVPNPTDAIRAALAGLGAECRDMRMSRTGLNPIADVLYAHRVASMIRSENPDVVIATGIKPILYGLPAAQAAGARIRVPLFAGLGAMFRPQSVVQHALSLGLQPLMRRMVRSATSVVTQNIDDTTLLVERFGRFLSVPPITTAGSGIDLAHFPCQPMPERRLVLMTSRIVPEKGVREFIGAARIVRARDPSVCFVIAGFFEAGSRGMSKNEFLADCRCAGVEYIGHVEDIRPVMAGCTVFALPSYYGEGRPRSIQEALATGRPVVTTDNVGCRDAIEDGVHGCIVPIRDDHALARGILAALELAAQPQTPRRCRQFAEQRYCASSIAADWLGRVGVLEMGRSP